ncbi:MAG: cell division protein CrgA [Actinomycetaceae bacterium]|nr:cell division protein CrgA [Actinomycetaceae bacterium]
MPESKKRKKVVQRRKEQARYKQEHQPAGVKRSPRWWAPLMVALALIGLLIVVLAYITGGNAPIPGFGNGNLFIGIGLMLAGFLMTMGWK